MTIDPELGLVLEQDVRATPAHRWKAWAGGVSLMRTRPEQHEFETS